MERELPICKPGPRQAPCRQAGGRTGPARELLAMTFRNRCRLPSMRAAPPIWSGRQPWS